MPSLLPLQLLLATCAVWVNRQQGQAIDYLIEQPVGKVAPPQIGVIGTSSSPESLDESAGSPTFPDVDPAPSTSTWN